MPREVRASGGGEAVASAVDEGTSAWLLGGACLLGLGLLHWTVIAAQSASRGADESLLSVAGFVAIELLLLLPLVPVARFQARRCLSTTDRRFFRLVVHGALALAVVTAYRGAVLSVALLVELGEVPFHQLEQWWRHAGPWQLQVDLLLYACVGGLFAFVLGGRSWRTRSVRGGTGDEASTVGGGRPSAAAAPASASSPGAGRLTVRAGGTVHVVAVEEIRWIEGAGTYVRIHATARSFLLRDTLESLTDRLQPFGFVRVHRSAILNLRHLESLQPAPRGRWTARLTDGASVRVAASRTERLEAALGDTLDR